MRIQRSTPRLYYRSRRRRSGCVPTVILLSLIVGLVVTTLNWLEQALNPTPSHLVNGDLRSAQSAFDRGDLDATIRITRTIWEHDSDNSDALLLLVRSLIFRSYADYDRDVDREIALEISTAAYEHLPDDPLVMTAHAFALQANLQPVESAQISESVLVRQPDATLARVVMGLAYGMAGGHDNALRINQAAPREGEWALDVYRALAIHYGDLGRYTEAITAIDRAININSRLLTLYFERAGYARLQGNFDLATASYFSILAFDPGNVKARLRMCEVSSLLRETDTALRYCTEVTEAAPRWSEGWYRLGREYYLQGNYAQAQQHLNRCTSLQVMQGIPIEERRFECWYMQGQASEMLGDCDNLLHTYTEFQEMAAQSDIPQTWVYPPEGPPMCVMGG